MPSAMAHLTDAVIKARINDLNRQVESQREVFWNLLRARDDFFRELDKRNAA